MSHIKKLRKSPLIPLLQRGNFPSIKRGLRGVFPSLAKRGQGRFYIIFPQIQTPILLAAVLLVFFILSYDKAFCGPYLNSGHGNSTYGVKRDVSGFPVYATGLCAHCHEQHASVGGAEPAPIGGTPSKYLLFYENYLSQTDGFCFECHKDINSYQSGDSIVNRSYSYRAGGWTNDTVNDLLEAFSFTSPDSSHSLDDIKTFITGKWSYTANSNPCNACHNPHSAQGDPSNAPNSVKSAASRGWPVSRPSAHSYDNNAWGLWGNDANEKMNNYTAGYQSPYRFNSIITYEPDGSTTQNGSNLTDYVTFCTDCHNDINTISSTSLGRDLYTFNWNTEKHGNGTALDGCPNILLPYQSGLCGNYVLSCTDCHEPHGSPNIFLIRKMVNSGEVTVDTGIGLGPDGRDNKEWVYLCGNCHDGLLADGNHTHPSFVPPDLSGCSAGACHLGGGDYRPCGECHYHLW